MSNLDNSSILITGGTGSLGKALIAQLLAKSKARRIAVFSRDELKQHDLREYFGNDQRLRWFLGDIRDLPRLERAFHGVDFVIHAAALKQVDTGEYNPIEFVKTNVLGSQNVIDAAILVGVKKVIALSTDKASSPINLYGATKLTSDKLIIAANNYSQAYGTAMSVVRYGNVMGSRGSVIPIFKNLASRNDPIPLTDIRMTRFWISLPEAVDFVIGSLEMMQGGELYVPLIPSMRLIDLAKAIAPNSDIIEIGLRPGEKLHEEMVSADDSNRTIAINNKRLVILPVVAEWGYVEPKGQRMPESTPYRSDTNSNWIQQEEIVKFIQEQNL